MGDVDQIIERSDPIIWAIVAVVMLVTLVLSAWTLNLSCRLCRLEPPGFVRALLTMIAISMTGAIASVWLEMATDSLPLWATGVTNFVVPIAVLCFMLPTDPLTAFLVTLVQGVIWLFVGMGMAGCAFLFLTFALA